MDRVWHDSGLPIGAIGPNGDSPKSKFPFPFLVLPLGLAGIGLGSLDLYSGLSIEDGIQDLG